MHKISRICLTITIAISMLVAFAPSASAQTWKHWDRARLNTLRAQYHLPPLRYNYRLQAQAQRWANHEAATGYTSQNFNTGPCWSIPGTVQYGDNASVATTVYVAEVYWEKSPSHRANILDPGFRFVGIGIAHANGWVWLDQVFCG